MATNSTPQSLPLPPISIIALALTNISLLLLHIFLQQPPSTVSPVVLLTVFLMTISAASAHLCSLSAGGRIGTMMGMTVFGAVALGSRVAVYGAEEIGERDVMFGAGCAWVGMLLGAIWGEGVDEEGEGEGGEVRLEERRSLSKAEMV